MLGYQDLSISSALPRQWTWTLALGTRAGLGPMPAAEGEPSHCHHSGDALNGMEQTHSALKALGQEVRMKQEL